MKSWKIKSENVDESNVWFKFRVVHSPCGVPRDFTEKTKDKKAFHTEKIVFHKDVSRVITGTGFHIPQRCFYTGFHLAIYTWKSLTSLHGEFALKPSEWKVKLIILVWTKWIGKWCHLLWVIKYTYILLYEKYASKNQWRTLKFSLVYVNVHFC